MLDEKAAKRAEALKNAADEASRKVEEDARLKREANTNPFHNQVHCARNIYRAAWMGERDRVVSLLAEGAQVNAVYKEGYTALMGAAGSGSDAIVEFLLDHGARINHQDNNGDTALIFAVIWGRESTVLLLIERGSDIDIKPRNNMTALLWARKLNKPAVERILSDAIKVTRCIHSFVH